MAMKDNSRLRKLEGSVYPILTAFTEAGAVDFDAVARYVDVLAKAGVPTVMTTVGTSRFNLLSHDEIRKMNETVVNAAQGRCLVIVAGPQEGSTELNISFARHAQQIGADAFIAFYPARWYGDDDIFAFFKAIAGAVDIGVMAHEMPMRSGYGGTSQYGLDLLDRLTDIPNLVGMKEECMDAGYAYKLHRRLDGKCGIIGAGSMRNFLRDQNAGAKAYLVGIENFFPRVGTRFAEAVRAGNIRKAQTIMRAYEDPYFDKAVQLGWHVALKETLHLMNLLPPYERAPLARLAAPKREELKALLEKLGWLGRSPDHEPVLGAHA